MRVDSRVSLLGALIIVGNMGFGASTAQAQGTGSSGSLGGYGAIMSGASTSMGNANIPYAGAFSGFMPFRMGGGGNLSFQTRGNSAMGSNRTSFSLMSTMSGGKGAGFGSDSGFGSNSGSLSAGSGMGIGMGMSVGQGIGRSRSPGVMPPSFGYPFRQPPSLLGSSSGAPGMSM